jgi:uncharacterized RDD family membrane protein YckC
LKISQWFKGENNVNDSLLPQQEPQVPTEGKRFGIRAGAYIIDTFVFFVVSFAVQFVISLIVGFWLIWSGQDFYVLEGPTQCLDYLISLVLFVLYFALFEWLYGATFGKVLLKMRVVTVDGEQCPAGPALGRSFLRFVDGLFFGILAYTVMKPPLYQRIGDKSAKTIVVSAQDPIIKQQRPFVWFLAAAGLYLVVDALFSLYLAMATFQLT